MIWKTYWWGVVNLFIDSSVEEPFAFIIFMIKEINVFYYSPFKIRG